METERIKCIEGEEQSAALTSEPLALATPSVSRKQKPTNFAKTCSWHAVRSNCPTHDCPSWLGQLPSVESVKRPIEYVCWFLSDDILESIVMQSNLYAVQENPSKPPGLTKNEFECFLEQCHKSNFLIHVFIRVVSCNALLFVKP